MLLGKNQPLKTFRSAKLCYMSQYERLQKQVEDLKNENTQLKEQICVVSEKTIDLNVEIARLSQNEYLHSIVENNEVIFMTVFTMRLFL